MWHDTYQPYHLDLEACEICGEATTRNICKTCAADELADLMNDR